MISSRLVSYTFFFGLLGAVGYLVWQFFAPFIGALAFAAIIVTICSPLYDRIRRMVPKQNANIASFISTLLVILIVIVPVVMLSIFIFREAASVYTLFNSNSTFSLTESLGNLEGFVQLYVPEFSLNATEYVQRAATFVTSNIAGIFTGAASTIFLLFISLIAMFYFFRDGQRFTKYLIAISPLPDDEDTIILNRLAQSVRSVVLGIVLVAMIQGVMTGIGLYFFGFERSVLWGSIAAFGALVPGIGTSIVFIPAVLYLVATGSYVPAIGVAVWAAFAVGLIDNILGPYLMSRGVTLHPFFILLAVLGGIIFFGPIGFVLGPVVLSLFKVLLELYSMHIAEN